MADNTPLPEGVKRRIVNDWKRELGHAPGSRWEAPPLGSLPGDGGYSKADADGLGLPLETRVVNARTGGEKNSKAERWDLLPMDQLAKVARLYAFGANKYADHNWRKGYDWNLSIAALYRHMAAFVGGEDFDAESQCEHLTSVVFHALALLWFMDEHRELDDRYERTPPKVEQGLRNLFEDLS